MSTNQREQLDALKTNHGGDFSKLGHATNRVHDEAELDAGDAERMKAVYAAAMTIAAQFKGNDFMQSIILGGLCNQADFLVESKNDRIDQVVGEIRQLREMNNNTEIDLNQMERKVSWMQTLVLQRTECEMYRIAVRDAYKAITGKDYVKPSKNESASAKKARRDANFTMLQVDALLGAADSGQLSLSSFDEEAAFKQLEKQHPETKGKQAKRA